MLERLRAALRHWLGVPELEPPCEHEEAEICWFYKTSSGVITRTVYAGITSLTHSPGAGYNTLDGAPVDLMLKVCRKCRQAYLVIKPAPVFEEDKG